MSKPLQSLSVSLAPCVLHVKQGVGVAPVELNVGAHSLGEVHDVTVVLVGLYTSKGDEPCSGAGRNVRHKRCIGTIVAYAVSTSQFAGRTGAGAAHKARRQREGFRPAQRACRRRWGPGQARRSRPGACKVTTMAVVSTKGSSARPLKHTHLTLESVPSVGPSPSTPSSPSNPVCCVATPTPCSRAVRISPSSPTRVTVSIYSLPRKLPMP